MVEIQIRKGEKTPAGINTIFIRLSQLEGAGPHILKYKFRGKQVPEQFEAKNLQVHESAEVMMGKGDPKKTRERFLTYLKDKYNYENFKDWTAILLASKKRKELEFSTVKI